MAITLLTPMRNAQGVSFTAQIDSGTGTAQIIFETSAPADVVTFDLGDPSFGAPSTGVITLSGLPITSSAASGSSTLAQFQMTNQDGTDQLQGTLGISGADINVTSLTINDTETFDLITFTVTIPVS